MHNLKTPHQVLDDKILLIPLKMELISTLRPNSLEWVVEYQATQLSSRKHTLYSILELSQY